MQGFMIALYGGRMTRQLYISLKCHTLKYVVYPRKVSFGPLQHNVGYSASQHKATDKVGESNYGQSPVLVMLLRARR